MRVDVNNNSSVKDKNVTFWQEFIQYVGHNQGVVQGCGLQEYVTLQQEFMQ